MTTRYYDLIVIGSGPAGEKGAAQAAYFGKRVALIEREPFLGGAGCNTGTVPSKTLRETAVTIAGFRTRALAGVELSLAWLTPDGSSRTSGWTSLRTVPTPRSGT